MIDRELSNKIFDIYFNDLKGINLTAIRDPEEFYQKQILDSILPYQHCEALRDSIQNSKTLVDIGFGGGFPLIPMALLGGFNCYGFESKNKKVEAVRFISEKLDLKNVKVFHHRVEEILFNKNVTLTFKAVGRIKDMLELINSTCEIEVFFYKGPNVFDLEGDDLNKITGWSKIEEKEINVPGTDKRFILGYRTKNVPRGTFKNLVKFSDFQ